VIGLKCSRVAKELPQAQGRSTLGLEWRFTNLVFDYMTTGVMVLNAENPGETAMYNISTLLLASGLMLAATSLPVYAQQLIPARFGNAESSLNKIISMPENVGSEDKVVRIPCQAIVEATGKVRDVNCFTDVEENSAYVQRILDAAKIGSISPALVNGVPTTVFMTFSAWFACSDGECNVLTLPHDNIHAADYGLNYFAPQAIIPGEEWYEGFAEKLQTIRDRGDAVADWIKDQGGKSANLGTPAPAGSVAYIVAVEVDENGIATKADVKRTVTPLADAADEASKGIDDVSFIPGYRDGKPFPMVYQEYGVVDVIPTGDDEIETFDSSSVMWDRATF
jgi:hypothetical protein